jgi:hypothetical protein
MTGTATICCGRTKSFFSRSGIPNTSSLMFVAKRERVVKTEVRGAGATSSGVSKSSWGH